MGTQESKIVNFSGLEKIMLHVCLLFFGSAIASVFFGEGAIGVMVFSFLCAPIPSIYRKGFTMRARYAGLALGEGVGIGFVLLALLAIWFFDLASDAEFLEIFIIFILPPVSAIVAATCAMNWVRNAEARS